MARNRLDTKNDGLVYGMRILTLEIQPFRGFNYVDVRLTRSLIGTSNPVPSGRGIVPQTTSSEWRAV